MKLKENPVLAQHLVISLNYVLASPKVPDIFLMSLGTPVQSRDLHYC